MFLSRGDRDIGVEERKTSQIFRTPTPSCWLPAKTSQQGGGRAAAVLEKGREVLQPRGIVGSNFGGGRSTGAGVGVGIRSYKCERVEIGV